MRLSTQKLMTLVVGVLTLFTLSATDSHASNGLTRGGGRVAVDENGNPRLMDLVTDGTCDWKAGREFAKSLPLFHSRVLRTLRSGSMDVFTQFLRESDYLQVCLTNGRLRRLTEEEKKEVTVYYLNGVQQVAVRAGQEVYIDLGLLRSLNDHDQAHLWLHELTHSFVAQDTFARMMKLMSFVKAVDDHGRTGFKPEELTFVMERNAVEAPQSGLARNVLQQVISSKDSRELKYLLDSGIDPNIALEFAIPNGDFSLFLTVLAAKPNPNLKTGNSYPLEKAALAGSLEMVQSLISAGADINQGRVLLYAASHGSAEPVISFVLRQPHLDLERQGMAEAIVAQVLSRNWRQVSLTDASVLFGFLKTNDGYQLEIRTPAPSSFRERKPELEQASLAALNALLQEPRAHEFMNRVISFAVGEKVRSGYYGYINEDYTYWRHREETALTLAARTGDTEAVVRLVQAGADVNVPVSKLTPLEILLENSLNLSPIFAKLEPLALALLDAPGFVLSPESKAKSGLLKSLIDVNFAQAAERVLRLPGVDVNAGYPLNTACYAHNPALVSRLLELGADPNGDGTDGVNCLTTALSAVRRYRFKKYEHYTDRSYGNRYNDEQKKAIDTEADQLREKYDEILALVVASPKFDPRALRKMNSDLELDDAQGNALHFAVEGNLPKTVAALVKRTDLDPNALTVKDSDKPQTALDLALNSWRVANHKQMALLLAQAPGINANAALLDRQVYCDAELRAAFEKAGGRIKWWAAPNCR